MCYRKKQLRNRVLPEHMSGFDKYWIKVPCCSCPSCKKVKNNDWLVRSYFEFLHNHNQAFFVSLDFDEQHLPRFHGQPCFDSEIMKDFLKRVRNRIGKFRYFYASEYGGLLKRPHYHVVFLPEKRFSLKLFMDVIRQSWQQGHYTDIQTLDSVNHNRLKAISYICEYVGKDISWNIPDTSDFPLRYRPRVQASKGFGVQALEEGYITPEMILSGSKVGIPIGKNGQIKSFPIPRYYEMKLCFDYKWHPDRYRAELTKNSFGVEVSKAKHNRYSVYYYNLLFSSRHTPQNLFDQAGIDLSVFGHKSWFDVLHSCFENREDFQEFIYFRSFIKKWQNRYISDTIRDEFLYRPNWSYYNLVCSAFDSLSSYFDSCTDKIETEKAILSAKKRAIYKIRRKPSLYRYLVHKNFDFDSLKF